MATSTLKDAKQSARAKSDPKGKHESDENTEVDAPPKKKKRNLLKTLLLIAPVPLIAGGGAAWYFLDDLQPEEETPRAAKAGPAKAAKAAPAKPPAFVPLGEHFTVNLQREDSDKILQVGLTLKVADAAYGEAVKLYMPDIRNRILLLLSNKKESQINTLEGKTALMTEIVREAAQALGTSVPAGGISSVLFTSFVIQ